MPIVRLRAPLRYLGDPPGPFSHAPNARDLRVFIDHPGALGGADPGFTEPRQLAVPTPEQLLWALCARDDIDSYYFSDDADDGEARPGAIRVGLLDHEADLLPFQVTRAEGLSERGVHPFSHVVGASWDSTGKHGIEVAVAIAEDLRVDVIASDRATRPSAGRPGNGLSARDALAIVGLYLRLRGAFPITGPPFTFEMGTRLAMWSAVRSLLPAGWEWGSALHAHGRAVGRDSPGMLAGTLFERLVRALRNRDQVHGELLDRHTNDTGRSVTEAFDYFLVNVVAAFDVAARGTHECLGISSKPAGARWLSNPWLNRVATRAPELATVFAPDAPARDVLKILSTLRRTLHSEHLRPVRHMGGGRVDTYVSVPRDDAEGLLPAIDRLGGAADWGLRVGTATGAHLHADVFVERAVPTVFHVLNRVLELTPIRLLDRASMASAAGAHDDFVFSAGVTSRVCLLLGLQGPDVSSASRSKR